jgi:cobalt/nickel transport system permease protein
MRPPTERRKTFLHRCPGGVKIAFALLFVIIIALLPRHPSRVYLVAAALLLVLWGLARMPWYYAARRLLAAEFLVLGVSGLTLLVPAAAPVFLATIIKSNLCVVCMLLLTWTTPFPEILRLLRRVYLPDVMLTTLALMSRYLPVLAQESSRMQRARASRSFSRERFVQWRHLAGILAQLFARCSDRAERIYLAMCARGWK